MAAPQMDRPRVRRGTPLTRSAWRLFKLGALIVGVVAVVGSLPVIAVWLASDELEAPAAASFAYRDEEISYASAGGVRIAARLRLPAGPGPHPAVVVAHGSGRVTRDRYEQISAAFAMNGWAFLSYDKRGVGESTGRYSGVGPDNSHEMFDLLAADIVRGAEAIGGRGDIDPARIGVYGISQGGWIGPAALAASDALTFMVIVSGPAVSVGEEIFYSQLSGETEGGSARGTDGELSAQLAGFPGPHGFDPVPVLERLDRPALWIIGSGDRSIPVPETVERLETLVEAGAPIDLVVLPDVGHGMRDLTSGARVDNFPRILAWLANTVGAGAR